MDRKPHVLIFG